MPYHRPKAHLAEPLVSDRIAVVDYGAGNLRSAARALAAAGAANVDITADPGRIARADRIVLPGVGAFAQCITALRGANGIEAALADAVQGRKVPFLGICVGMQLLATEGHEHGVHQGLGWLPGVVTRLTPADPALKIPHMGWNRLQREKSDGLLDGLPDDAFTYFVHSYAVAPGDWTVASVDYGTLLSAIVRNRNFCGMQFHPERSGAVGALLLKNFLSL